MYVVVRSAATIAALLACGRPLWAQCPDGTPPPCRTRAAAPATRANPPLDERTWIVLPFENIARAQDIDWLRDASVNLLYLDLSRWQDIRVIDDERVADLMREVLLARAGTALSLEAGLAVARRAGAGKLVMGDLLKVGSRTQVVAKVFDVRSGQRVRTVREETAVADSLMGVFGRLARGILNANPPSGATLGIGTARLDAYQEYVAGVRALNAFDMVEARARFDRALRLDSTFALAYYKLSLVLGWTAPADPEHRRTAEAAARHGAGLPPRERALIAAQAQSTAGDYGRACETIAPLVRADSNDVEALYGLGECSYHDQGVVPVPGDTTRFMFRTSWNTALWAFRRVLTLDPTYHLAFQHIGDAYEGSARTGCLVIQGRPTCGGQGENSLQSALRRDGDSLVHVPVRVQGDAGRAVAEQFQAARRDGSRRRNLEEARRAAEEWLTAGPNEPRARIANARALLRLGRIPEAAAILRQMPAVRISPPEAGLLAVDRIEIAIKTDELVRVPALLDSLRAQFDTVAAVQVAIGVVSAMLGRPARLDTVMNRLINGPDWVKSYFRSSARAVLGLPDDSLIAREAPFVQRAGGGRSGAALGAITGSFLYAMRRRTPGQWPQGDTAHPDQRVRAVSFLAAGDTAGFRRALSYLDSLIDIAVEEPDNGAAIVSIEGHLLLRDTAVALRRLRTFHDRTLLYTPLTGQIAPGFGQTGMLWPRMFLLLGNLAAATGARDDARAAYRRFIALWEHGDREVQPLVQRARQALAGLGAN